MDSVNGVLYIGVASNYNYHKTLTEASSDIKLLTIAQTAMISEGTPEK